MPGLCGVVQPAATPSAGEIVTTMLGRMSRYAWHLPSQVEVAGAAFGHSALVPAGGRASRGVATAGHLTVAFDGELYAGEEPAQADAAVIAEHLLRDGPSFFARRHGCFSCAVWDDASLRLSIATDRYGMRGVYWTRVGDRFLFASELGALLAVDGIPATPDESGLAQFLSFGHYLGEATRYREMTLVPAGCWLTFDAQQGTVTATPYVDAGDRPSGARSDSDWQDLIAERTVASVGRACADAGALGLSLSGGLDARTILGVAPPHQRLTCVSLGIAGSIDHRAASQLAALAGQPHHQMMLADDFLARFEALFREVVDLTDGLYLDQGIVLTTLPAYRELGIQTLLRGHAGELMHMSKAYSFSIDDDALRLASKEALVDWLWRHLSAYMIGSADESLFTGPFAGRMRDMARAALEAQVAAWDHVEPIPQRIWRLFVAQRLRRETAPSLQLFRNFVETRVPLLDPDLVDPLLEAPPHLKIGDRLQAHILGRHRPDFLGVVNANTGAPMSAGPWVARLAYLRMKVLGRLGVAGYQPYERLGLWLARDLKPLVHRLLLSERFSDRGLFEPAGIRALLEQHESRQRNHTYLIMALLVLEIAERAEA